MPRPTDAEWIGPLYDRYGASLYRYALMVLADPEAAADVVQTVFVSLLRRDLLASAGPILESVEGAVERPDERIALERALRGLPADQREVVHLKSFEGMTFQEIAELTDESINTIASRYRYAIEKLRASLA